MAVPISNVVRRIVFAPSGTGPYAFTFEILAATDIEVYKGDTLLTLTTDYTVTINPNGTGSVTLVATAGTDNITIVGARTIQRTTDFVTGGDLFANSLNEELDSLTIFTQQNAEAGDRSIRAPVTDPTTIDMTLPTKTARAGKYLSFNASTGNPEVVNTVLDITAVANNTANINTVAGQISPVNNISTVAGVAANITTVAGIAANVTTVAGISGNVTTVAGISADVTAVAGDATDIGLVAAVSSDVAALGPIAADITAVAGDATDIGTVAADLTGSDTIGTVAGIASAVSTVAGISSDVTTVAADGTDIGTVAGLSTEITALGPIASDITTVSGIAANVTSVAGNASNINQVASDTVAINAASANATAAANSATAAASSATSAANSAAAANAVVLGNEPVAPSIRPSLLLDFANTKALDPRVSFVRTTTAVYYNGVTTAKAEENLVLYSQEFDNAWWLKTNSTVTSNTVAAPDGTTTAETVNEETATGTHQVNSTNVSFVSGLPYTTSFFVKADTVLYVQIIYGSAAFGVNAYANFDVSTGVLGTVGASATATITSVGNSWYRCTMTATATSSASVATSIGAITTSTSARAESYTGTSKVFYLWGAQLEQRSAVTDYTPTTTQPITNYIPVLLTAASGVARFDHNPTTGESLGLLVEEQRANLVVRSEEFDNASWTKTNATITANTIVAPDGTLSGEKLVENTNTSTHNVFQQVATSAGAVTATFYVKAAERSYCQIRFQEGGSFLSRAEFDLATGQAVPISGSLPTISNVGNGWYRISLTATSAGSATFQSQLFLIENSTSKATSYQGNGYDGIYIWGAQLEAGAFPTSYIPTVAATVTRNADAASMTGANFSSWYAGGAGTVYSESAVYAAAVKTQSIWQLGGGVTTTSLRSPQATTARLRAAVGGTFSGAGTGAVISNNTFIKATVAWQGLSGRLQSGATGEDITAAANLDATELAIGSLGGTSSSLNGHIRKIAFYPTRLSNAQLQALTTI
jgi:hypothetical protein